MRKKEERFVVTFATTTGAMAMERACRTAGLPGRLIPVPRSITAGCGMCWSAPPDARQALEALREQGVEQIQFVTTLKTTTLSVEDLLAEGGSWFALEHDGLVSRRLSAAQAESLKCRMR